MVPLAAGPTHAACFPIKSLYLPGDAGPGPSTHLCETAAGSGCRFSPLAPNRPLVSVWVFFLLMDRSERARWGIGGWQRGCDASGTHYEGKRQKNPSFYWVLCCEEN